MTAVQFIVSPSGEELAVLPRAEYERLAELDREALEEAADTAVYREAKTEWDAQGRPTFPPELSALLLRTKSRLAAIRKWRGLSQQALASKADIKQGYLSDMETGRRPGAQATVERLAKALEVPTVWLI